MRTSHVAGGVGLMGALVLGACAGASAGNDPSFIVAGSGGAETYAVLTTLLQPAEDAAPQLCLGGVMESYPPQCGGGLDVIGLDWDDVADAETASGVTWGTGWVVGTYDSSAGTFTLTQPAGDQPPAGLDVPEPDLIDFPALCEDPYRGGEASFDPGSAEGMTAREELVARAAQLDGYITVYVSDGDREFNVLVQGDAEAAHSELREVWPGWLCVATGSGASEADVLAAQEAVHAALGEQVLGSGGGVDGVLEVSVLVADESTTQAVLDAVEPWLTPQQVRVTGVLLPVG